MRFRQLIALGVLALLFVPGCVRINHEDLAKNAPGVQIERALAAQADAPTH